MFEVEGNNYDLRYSEGAIERIEEALDRSVMDILARQKGYMKLSDLKTMIAFALINPDSSGSIPYDQGIKVASKYIEAEGYATALTDTVGAMQRDVPFLFRVG